VLLLLCSLLTKPTVARHNIAIEAEPGDLLLFTSAEGLNKSITWLTKSRYYHIGIYCGDNHVVESRPRGVVFRDLNGPDGDRSFVVIPAPGGRQVGLDALQWAAEQLGDGYDAGGAAVIILDHLFRCSLPYTSKNHFSCGELVTKAYLHAGYDLFPGESPESVVPGDFEKFLPGHERTRNVVK